jgi:hypothetical protein
MSLVVKKSLMPVDICSLDLKVCYTPCRWGKATNKKRCPYRQESYFVFDREKEK